MTGLSKNLFRFSSLLVAVAMFLGLAVAGCGDEGSKDGAEVTPFDTTAGKVVFRILTEAATAKSSAKIDMYGITALDKEGNAVATRGFAAPGSQIVGSDFYAVSGDQRTCTWNISGIDELGIAEFRIDGYEGNTAVASAFVVAPEILTTKGAEYVEDKDFEFVGDLSVKGSIDIQVLDTDRQAVTELEAGQSAGVFATFVHPVSETVDYVESAEVTLDETEAAEFDPDFSILTAKDVTEDTDVTLRASVLGLEDTATVTVKPAAVKSIVFGDEGMTADTMTEQDEQTQFTVSVVDSKAFTVFLKTVNGENVEYAEIARTDAQYDVNFDNGGGLAELADDAWTISGNDTEVLENSLTVSDKDDAAITGSLAIEFVEQSQSIVFGYSDRTEDNMTEQDEITSADAFYTSFVDFTVFLKTVTGDQVEYVAIERTDAQYDVNFDNGGGLATLDDSAWTIAGNGTEVMESSLTISDKDDAAITGVLTVNFFDE